MKNNMTTTVISSISNDKDDNDKEKVVIFRRVKRDSCGYIIPNKYENVFYKEIILNGKPCFERVYLKNNNNKTK
jgi:hypothetical protein